MSVKDFSGNISQPRLIMRFFVLLFVTVLFGCGQQESESRLADLRGSGLGSDFSFLLPDGESMMLSDRKGKVVSVFFGFANCPDVCPTHLAKMKAVKAKLGKAAKGLDVLFVTLDPNRDTPPILGEYVAAFDEDFVGAWVPEDDLPSLISSFGVFRQKIYPENGGEFYTIDHSSGSFIIDADGTIRFYVGHDDTVDTIAAAVMLLQSER